MKDLKTDKIACMEIINIVMLFLFSIHFMGGKEKYILVWGVISVVWFGILNKKILWDGDFVVLMVLSILHGIIYKYYYTEISGYTWRQMVFMTFPPLLMYLVCKQIIWQKKQDLVVKVLLIIGYGTFLYSILNFIAFLQEGFYPQGRIWNEFWMRSPRYATEFSYWGVFIVGLLGYALYCFSEKKWIQGGAICICIGIENYINICVDNRMVLAVTMLIAIVAVFLYIYFNRRDKEKIKKILILALVIGLLGAGIIVFNIGGIRNTSYYDNFISRDGGIIGNVRFKMIWEMLQLLPSHWKGGATVHLYGMNAIHNYWLQVANDTGIFTFILWMIFNISALYSTVKVVISPHIKEGLKYALVLMLVAAASYLMMEIGGSGRSTYIIFYIMLVAIMKQTLKNIETT